MIISTGLKLFRNRHSLKRIIDSYLFFEKNSSQTFWGSIIKEDESAIIENVKKAASYRGPIIEIGALFGFTTQLIATYKPKEKKLIAVENFSWNPFYIPRHDHQIITERVLVYCMKYCNTHIYDQSNRTFYKNYNDETPSMTFIDADHSYKGVMEDIEWSENMGIPIICGHDYCKLHPGIIRAVDEVYGDKISVTGSVWTAIKD